jgi:hypothetical protein
MCNYERQLNAAAATPGTVANAEPPIIAPTITTVSTLPPSNAPAAPVLNNCNNSLINDLNEKLTGLQSRLRKAHELLEIQSTAEAIASIALAIQRLQQISQ